MNPRGRFGLTLHNEDLRYTNRDYEEAIKRGELDHLLLDVGTQERYESDNLLFHRWLTFLFFRSGWSGCPTPPTPYSATGGPGPGIWVIYLSSYDTGAEPTYLDDIDTSPGYSAAVDTMVNNCGTGCGRRFYNDQSHPFEVWSDTTEREQIFFRNRWFYLPHHVTASQNNIRGVIIVWSDNATATAGVNNERGMGRVRFKDAEGNFVRIHKTNYQAMSLEYTFSMLSV